MTDDALNESSASPARILYVEDDALIRKTTTHYLEANGMDVIPSGSAEDALEVARRNVFDAALIDWMLPKASGLELCAELRKSGYSGPIAVLTSKSEADSQISGHESGADHYWVKPIPARLLLAKLQAVVRVARQRAVDLEVCEVGAGRFDAARSILECGGRTVELAAKHSGILKALLQARGGWVSREDLLARVWRYKAMPHTRTVDNFIVELRRQLREVVGESVEIRSKRNLGYALQPADAAKA
jgi:DNA-binding response OmpR family regulator